MYHYTCKTCFKNFESPKKDRKYCGKDCTALGNKIKQPKLTKICTCCKTEKNRDEFWKKKGSIHAVHSECIECAKKNRHTEEYREKRRPLDRKKRRKYLGLDPEFKGNYKTGPKANPETRWLNKKNGYILLLRRGHPNSQKKGTIFEHVFIMSEYIGRPLHEKETVHHINGIKTDNRIENLELWSHSHPYGQRIDDKISWCIEFLNEYGYDVIKR